MIRLDFAPLWSVLAATNVAALLFYLATAISTRPRRTRARTAAAAGSDPLDALIRAIEEEERGGKKMPQAAGSCRPLRAAS